MKAAPLVRFLAKRREDPSGCWIWTGAVGQGKGDLSYGQIWMNGKLRRAPRVSHELFVGPIPDGATIDHLCRTPLCVNPNHLEAVSVRENILRGESPTALNARKTECKRGHALLGANVLIEKKGRWCRECRRASDRRRRKFNEAYRSKRRIAQREAWRRIHSVPPERFRRTRAGLLKEWT
jgi:HNH endonuclease